MAEAAKKTTARKSAAKKTTARKTAARKPAAKKPAARKPAARKPAARKAAPKSSAQSAGNRFSENVQETGRNVLLLSLGVYGKAYDEAQARIDSLQSELQSRRKQADKSYQARRKQADKLYKELVKRGTKVEKDAKGAINDIELPKIDLEVPTRKDLEKQFDKARERFAALKTNFGFKTAA